MHIVIFSYRSGPDTLQDGWTAYENESDANAEYARHIAAGAYTVSVCTVRHSTDY